MNKNNYQTVALTKGVVTVYDFGQIRLHAYQTNDLISDEVFIVEKDGQAIIIELPCFKDNIAELSDYLSQQGINPLAKLAAYHMAGASFLPQVPLYSTRNAADYGHNGGGKALIDNFAQAFGDSFDNSIASVTNYLEAGPVTLAGIQLNITPTEEAFDIELPQINTVYTHMLGHDCHSIVAGHNHADAIISQLEGYLAKGYDLVLTSHYTPEDLKDVASKIAYLKALKEIAANCADAEGFSAAVKQAYPGYSGDNYLQMTAGFFFS